MTYIVRKNFFSSKSKAHQRARKTFTAEDSVLRSPCFYFYNTFLGIFSFTLHSSLSVYPVLQMRKQRLGEGQLLAQGQAHSQSGLEFETRSPRPRSRRGSRLGRWGWGGWVARLGAAKQGRVEERERLGEAQQLGTGSLGWSQGINMNMQPAPLPLPSPLARSPSPCPSQILKIPFHPDSTQQSRSLWNCLRSLTGRVCCWERGGQGPHQRLGWGI